MPTTPSTPTPSPPAKHRALSFTKLAVSTSIGIHPKERQQPQRVLIDLTLTLDPDREPTGDDIAATLDYDRVRHGIIAIAQQQHYDLQETLARHLLDYCLTLPQVIGARVVTAKPDAYDDCDSVSYCLAAGDIPGVSH